MEKEVIETDEITITKPEKKQPKQSRKNRASLLRRAPENTITSQKQQFAMWLGLPAYGREDDEQTLEQYAAKYGLAPSTLKRWSREPRVQEMASNAIKVLGGNEKLKVIRKMIEQAIEGRHQQQKMYLEWLGELGQVTKKKDLTPKEIKISFNTEMEVSSDGSSSTDA
jgi:hypothetical protein